MDDRFHGLDIQKVIDFYLKGVDTNSSLALKQAFSKFYGDLTLKCSTYWFAKRLATIPERVNTKGVYFYEVSYQWTPFAEIFGCNEPTMGICHGADTPFVFGDTLLLGLETNETDIEFTKYVMKLWTNFVKYG